MKAGKLRHRITIQEASERQDSTGAVVNTWVDRATIWAAVEPLSGRELVAAQALNAETSTRIRTRYWAGITPKMRASWGDHIYDILSVVELESAQRELHLMCKEIPV